MIVLGSPSIIVLALTLYETALAFSPDSSLLAIGTSEGVIEIWNAQQRQLLTPLRTTAIAGSATAASGRMIWAVEFSANASLLAVGAGDGSVRLWDLASGKETILTGHRQVVYAVTFSPNGELLASSSHDCTIKLWNVVTQSKPQTINGHSDGVIDLAFVRDGLTLVSAGLDYFIRFWPIDQQVETNSLGDDKRTGQIAFTDDKTVASLRDGTICLWELETGASKPFSHEAPQDIECFAVSRGGLLAMKVPHAIEIWDVLTRTKRMA